MEQRTARDDLEIPAQTYRVAPPRKRILDMDTRRLAMVAGFVACGLALVVSVWTALSGGRSGPVPVVTADGRPLKMRPENPGGMQTAGLNDDILSAGRGSGQLAPPPEAPAPQVLRQRQQAAEEAARQAAEAARQAATAPPMHQVSAPTALPPALPPPSIAAPRPATAQPNAGQPNAGLPNAGLPSAGQQAPGTQAATAAPAGTKAAPPSKASKATVQLAALGTEQAAKQEWQRLSKKMPEVFNGHQPVVSRTERDGKTYFRLRTGGFSDQAQATAFCDRVKAKGASCSVSVF